MLPDMASRRGLVPDLKLPELGYIPPVAFQIAPAGKTADTIKLHHAEFASKKG